MIINRFPDERACTGSSPECRSVAGIARNAIERNGARTRRISTDPRAIKPDGNFSIMTFAQSENAKRFRENSIESLGIP